MFSIIGEDYTLLFRLVSLSNLSFLPKLTGTVNLISLFPFPVSEDSVEEKYLFNYSVFPCQ